jgi:peptidoglycan/LPS O-acetylase OafA/YrhL
VFNLTEPDKPKPTVRKRMDYIDGLRGVAVLLVLLTHTWTLNGAPAFTIHFHGHGVPLATIPAVGHVGVDLFLVLSGFCLAWPFMINPGYRDRINFYQFLRRRFLRIAPAYYASIVLLYAFSFLFGKIAPHLPHKLSAFSGSYLASVPGFGEILPHLAFVHNLTSAHVSTINGSYWSLALEFQLYLLFPLMIELMFRIGVVRTALIALICQVAYSSWINSDPLVSQIGYEFVLQKAVFARAFEFMCGIAAAWVIAQPADKKIWLRESGGAWLSAVTLAAGFLFSANPSIGMPYVTIDLCWAVGFSTLVWRPHTMFLNAILC